MDSIELAQIITSTVRTELAEAGTSTRYREPLVGFVAADDPRFLDLRRDVEPTHMLPRDLLPGARTVISFFLPFESTVVEANAQHKDKVAREWVVAYVETNALIGQLTEALIAVLAEYGIRAAAEPATHNFDPETLVSRWSHKSVGVLAGLGSFGLHHLVITDAGCVGRFGSLVIDVELPVSVADSKQRCLFFHDGSCIECIARCPISALRENGEIDKQSCWDRLQRIADAFEHLGVATTCGKCSIGPCAVTSAL